MNKKILILIIISFLFLTISNLIIDLNNKKDDKQEYKQPNSLEIEECIQPYQSYEEIINVFKKWEDESSNLIDVKTYGESSKGKPQYYIKISNEISPGGRVVLVTAGIHGNEPLSTSVVVSYAAKILSLYGKDKEITELVNSTNLYFVPVVSPDSYPNNRSVDGVDPNRDFPTLKNPNKESVLPVKNLQNLFLQIKPNSVLSGHTYGRVYLIPWGDSIKDNPNHEDYKRIVGEMSELANYGNKKASQLYSSPIFGTEIDWYHRNGAFAIVSEFGTHQRKPSFKDTKEEFERTFSAFLFFLKESTKVLISN